MPEPFPTIAVDLTPLLPGGDNGGARIFVLELLRFLAEIAPQARFVLLTQAASHELLAGLDAPNLSRLMLVGPGVGNALRPWLLGIANRTLPWMPSPLRRGLSRLGYGLNRALKRGGSGRRLRELGADLLFCPFTAPTYWEPGLATVSVLYDLQFRSHPELFAAEDIANRERSFLDACRQASCLVAISDYSRGRAIAEGGLDPGRIRTIRLRLAHRLARAEAGQGESDLLQRLGLEPGGYLLYPANFWPHKNHARLLSALQIASRLGLPERIALVCTGAPGPRLERVRAQVAERRLEGRVHLPGYLTDRDLAALMRQSAGLVFPSFYEGFGLPVLEAMAAGVPVACSRCTALPEVAGEAAIYFDPLDEQGMARALCDLVLDEGARGVLVERGLARARELADVRQMALDYWLLFEQQISTPCLVDRRS